MSADFPESIWAGYGPYADLVDYVVAADYNAINDELVAVETALARGLGVFGDGSDGDVTISGNTTLTRDMYYNSLTVNAGVTLTTAGYKIFVRGLCTVNGTICNNGASGGNAAGTTGGTAGSSASGGSTAAPPAAQDGADAPADQSNGNNGDNGESVANSANAEIGSLGGNGGAATGGYIAGNGGSAGSATAIPATDGGWRDVAHLLAWRTFPAGSAPLAINWTGGGSGAGSGGADRAAAGGGGGGGGGNGGVVFTSARALYVSATGAIEANGGDGGDGGDGGTDGIDKYGGGGGGGAGGNGGFVVIIALSVRNEGSIVADEGALGGGGAAGGVGAQAGADGLDGVAGIVVYL